MSSNTLETFSGGGGRGGRGGGSWSCAVEGCLGLPLPPHVFLARFSSSDMCAQNLNDEGAACGTLICGGVGMLIVGSTSGSLLFVSESSESDSVSSLICSPLLVLTMMLVLRSCNVLPLPCLITHCVTLHMVVEASIFLSQ